MPTSHPSAGFPAVTQTGFGCFPALQPWDIADRAARGQSVGLSWLCLPSGALEVPVPAQLEQTWGTLPVRAATNIVFPPLWLRHQLRQGR